MNERGSGVSSAKLPWSWHPSLPIDYVPLFAWPPRPWDLLKFYLGRGFLWSVNLIFVGIAISAWLYLGADVAQWSAFKVGWVAQVYVLNLSLLVLVTGGSHLFFYTLRAQGEQHRFDCTPLGNANPKFFTGSQIRDNVFWTCGSGAIIWTAWQVGLMWAYGNELLPSLDYANHPVWTVILFPLIVVWFAFHFYVFHRLLHTQPLYKFVHAIHHRNVNVSPWSGLAMHPVEHVFYFSTIIVHLFIPSHPVHMFFHIYFAALAAGTTHTGYSDLLIKRIPSLGLGDFYHQLHHRYFECNYGTPTMPWDKWFGTFHDGTVESAVRMRRRKARMRGPEVGDG